MKRVSAFLQSKQLRVGFMLLALAAAIWAVAANWDAVRYALEQLPLSTVLLCLALSLIYVILTMLSWRAILDSTGEKVNTGLAAKIFFVSQLAKYIPGGVWNFVAAAEMGTEHQISRRRSVSVLAVSVLTSMVTGVILSGIVLIAGPTEIRERYWWLVFLIPLGLVALAPPALNRLIAFALKLLGRDPLEQDLTWKVVLQAGTWSLLAWIAAGTQVWLILAGTGEVHGFASYSLAVSGYALGWIAGFLVFFAPAGVGVREAVLGAVLSLSAGTGTVVVVVLLSRVLITLADILLGLTALLIRRRKPAR